MASETRISTRNGMVIMRIINDTGEWTELPMHPSEANGLADLLNDAAYAARRNG